MKRKLILILSAIVFLILVATSIYFFLETKKLTLVLTQNNAKQRQELNKAIESNNFHHQQEIELIRESEKLSGILSAFDSVFTEPQNSYNYWNLPLTTYTNNKFECTNEENISTDLVLQKVKSNYPIDGSVLFFCKTKNKSLIMTDTETTLHLYQLTIEGSNIVKNRETHIPLLGNSQNTLTAKLLKWKTLPELEVGEWAKFQIEEYVDKNLNPQWETIHTNKYIYEWQDTAEPALIEKCLINYNTSIKPKSTYCTHVVSSTSPIYGK